MILELVDVFLDKVDFESYALDCKLVLIIMTLSTIISITITLTFIYLVLSIVTSEIQEIIATALNLRAKNLKQSIIHLLGEHQDESNLTITNKLYEQYLTPTLNPSRGQKTKSPEPSNISSKKFTNGLIETVREVLQYKDEVLNHEDESSRQARLQQVIDDINKSSLPEKLKTDLSSQVQKAKRKFTKTEKELQYLEEEIQDWFNDSMEYASEIYKQKAKVISFVLGLILVLTFDVDTINIIDKLSKSEVLVSTFNNAAIEVIKSNSDIDSCSEADKEVNIKTCITDIQDQLNIALDDIDNLPIGWNLSAPFKEQFRPFNIPNVVNVIIGWLISAIAISMGAPFWFTVLRNLINLKSSQTSQEKK